MGSEVNSTGNDAALASQGREPSETQLRTLVEQASDGIFLADLHGRYTYVNEAGCRMLGYEREEIVGKSIVDLIPPGEVGRLWSEQSAMLDGQIRIGEWMVQRKDGTWLPVEVSAKIHPDGQWQGFVRDISERKQLEAEREALFRQVDNDRQWLQTVIDTVPMGMLLFLPEGRLTFNRRTEELLGMKLSPTAGSAQYASRILFADGRPVPPEELPSARALRGTTIIAEDYIVERSDGSRAPVIASVAPIRNPDGRVIGIVGAFQDVSERVRAEEQVREKQRLLQAIFDILPVGVFIADKTGRLVQTNPAAERIWTGVRYVGVPEYGQYQGWWVDTGKPIAPEDWGMARAIMKGETSLRELIRIQCFDGSFKTVIHHAMPLRGEAGEIEGGVVVIEDITALHEAQEKRRRSEQLLRTVIDLLPVGLWIADRDGRITLTNPAGARIWQGTRHVGPEQYGEYKGWSLETGEPIGAEEWGLTRALKRGETSRAEVIRIQCFDGSFKTVVNFAAPIKSASGEITGAVAVNEDITALQRTQDQLRAAVTDREHILAIVSHDLRNPLAVILSGLEAVSRAARSLPGGEKISDFSAVMLGAASGMSGLIDDLLAVAVSATGRSMFTLEPVAAGDVLAQAAVAARPLLARKSISLEVQSSGPLPMLSADPARISRVFANLTDNAFKFTPDRGTVTFAAETVAGGARFSVANSGQALPADQLDLMFQPFWQAARSDTRGTGLGLSICRSIVEAHGGTIWAEPAASQRLRICFVLPPAAAVGDARVERPQDAGGPAINPPAPDTAAENRGRLDS